MSKHHSQCPSTWDVAVLPVSEAMQLQLQCGNLLLFLNDQDRLLEELHGGVPSSLQWKGCFSQRIWPCTKKESLIHTTRQTLLRVAENISTRVCMCSLQRTSAVHAGQNLPSNGIGVKTIRSATHAQSIPAVRRSAEDVVFLNRPNGDEGQMGLKGFRL
jgi:hypothetical protein